MSTTQIKTKPYGDIEIQQDDILDFPNGIFAFESFKRFVIIQDREDNMLAWLQSLDDPELAFLIIDPSNLVPNYTPEILASEIERTFGTTGQEGLHLYCIITIPANQPEKMTVNLQGPLVVDSMKKIGGQFISNDDNHQVRMPVLELVEAGEIAQC